MDLVIYKNLGDLYAKCEGIRESFGANTISFISTNCEYGFWLSTDEYPDGAYVNHSITEFKDRLCSVNISCIHFLSGTNTDIWKEIDLSVFACISNRCKDVSVNWQKVIPLNVKKELLNKYNKLSDTSTSVYHRTDFEKEPKQAQ